MCLACTYTLLYTTLCTRLHARLHTSRYTRLYTISCSLSYTTLYTTLYSGLHAGSGTSGPVGVRAVFGRASASSASSRHLPPSSRHLPASFTFLRVSGPPGPYTLRFVFGHAWVGFLSGVRRGLRRGSLAPSSGWCSRRLRAVLGVYRASLSIFTHLSVHLHARAFAHLSFGPRASLGASSHLPASFARPSAQPGLEEAPKTTRTPAGGKRENDANLHAHEWPGRTRAGVPQRQAFSCCTSLPNGT